MESARDSAKATGLGLRREIERAPQMEFAKEYWRVLQWGFEWEKPMESGLEYQWAAGSESGKERLKVVVKGWRMVPGTVER